MGFYVLLEYVWTERDNPKHYLFNTFEEAHNAMTERCNFLADNYRSIEDDYAECSDKHAEEHWWNILKIH